MTDSYVVTLTLTEALDEESEGVRLELSEDSDVILMEVPSTTNYEKIYQLSNGSSLAEYEEVCKNIIHTSTLMHKAAHTYI